MKKRMFNKNLIIGVAGLIIIGLIIGSYFMFFYSPYKFTEDRPIKIFHLNSYHYGFELVSKNIAGFEQFFENKGIDVEIRKFEMDLIRDHSEENRIASTKKAIEEISAFQPDLIYATDDEGQKLVIKPTYLNADIPVVFSGINDDYEDYNYGDSKNIVGIYERLLFVEAVNFLLQLSPSVKRIAVMSDDFPQWEKVIKRFKEKQKELPNIEFVGWNRDSTFKEYKENMLAYQEEVDAFMVIGLTNFKDEEGNNVLLEEVVRWNVENIKLPDLTFWDFSVKDGILLGYEISAFEQGKAAGKMAYDILIKGKKPSSFEFKTIDISEKYLNLARAKTIGIEIEDIPSVILINSEVYVDFPWEKAE
jgi:ABC-type uncharacterized transport system substrate-binding protein